MAAEGSNQVKSERSISPNTMNEEDRRELIARQQRALYSNDGSASYDRGRFSEGHTPRPNTQAIATSGSAAGGRGQSPRAFNSFGMSTDQGQNASVDNSGQYSNNESNAAKGPSPKPQQSRSRANSTSSPASNNQSFSIFDNAAQQSSRTSTSSPGGSPPRQSKNSNAPIGSGVAPIGTRPSQTQAINLNLSKRSTTPLPSPLSYGFAPNESAGTASGINERSTSAASNPTAGAKENNINMNWGSSSGVWGKTPLGVQASVWG